MLTGLLVRRLVVATSRNHDVEGFVRQFVFSCALEKVRCGHGAELSAIFRR